ncbi:MAG: hypothetical protein ACD_76C00047G0001, partial [uncultured bacterium]
MRTLNHGVRSPLVNFLTSGD